MRRVKKMRKEKKKGKWLKQEKKKGAEKKRRKKGKWKRKRKEKEGKCPENSFSRNFSIYGDYSRNDLLA